MSSEDGVLVLGGMGGIGRACVDRFAEATVVTVDQAPGADVVGDVTSVEVIREALALCRTRGATPNTLVHCVLSEVRAPLAELTAADWHSVLDAGLVSAWQAGAELVAGLDGTPATITLVGSVHAHGAAPGMAAYAVTKAAMPALARAMAVEWGPLGVRCNVVEPGFVAVERNAHRWRDAAERQRILDAYPIGRLCRPEEIAEVIAFLASPAASYITGAVIPVDGGSLAVLPEVRHD